MAHEKGAKAGSRPGVFQVTQVLHSSDLPDGIITTSTPQKDKKATWLKAGYWELADGNTGAGYGGDVWTFIKEGTQLDEDTYLLPHDELIWCPFSVAYFPTRAVLETEVVLVHHAHVKARRYNFFGMKNCYVAGSAAQTLGGQLAPTSPDTSCTFPEDGPGFSSATSRTGRAARLVKMAVGEVKKIMPHNTGKFSASGGMITIAPGDWRMLRRRLGVAEPRNVDSATTGPSFEPPSLV